MTFKIFVHCDDDIRLCRRSLINLKHFCNIIFINNIQKKSKERC